MFRLKWQPHDFGVWANRRLIHRSTPEAVYSEKGTRLFHLVFLNSEDPIKAARDC